MAQFIDGGVKTVVKIDKGIGRPKLLTQFLPRYYLAGLLQQQHQNLKRLVLELDLPPVLVQFTSSKIDFEAPKTDSGAG